MASAHGFDDENVRHDGEDIVVRREGCEPVDGKIVYPDNEDWQVDGQDPEHQDEYTVHVVIEIVVVARALRLC